MTKKQKKKKKNTDPGASPHEGPPPKPYEIGRLKLRGLQERQEAMHDSQNKGHACAICCAGCVPMPREAVAVRCCCSSTFRATDLDGVCTVKSQDVWIESGSSLDLVSATSNLAVYKTRYDTRDGLCRIVAPGVHASVMPVYCRNDFFDSSMSF